MSACADKPSEYPLRELLRKSVLDTCMRKLILSAAIGVAMVGAAIAQIEASSSVYFLDVDPARYAGPPGQRLAVRLDDAPRHITLGTQDEICVQLQRVVGSNGAINARVRALRPEPHDSTDIRVVAPDISPGTFRSTPWGLLLRVVPPKNAGSDMVKAVGTTDSPTCTL
jgi:hypothetical protein